MYSTTDVGTNFFPCQTANAVHFQGKVQLSGYSAFPDSSPSKLNRVIGILLY